MEVLSVVGLAIVASFFSLFLKSHRKEYGVLLALAASIVIVAAVFPQISKIFILIRTFSEQAGLSETLQPVIRALGIAIITQLGADICRDCGEESLASKVEFAGKTAILILCIPLFTQILDMISSLMA